MEARANSVNICSSLSPQWESLRFFAETLRLVTTCQVRRSVSVGHSGQTVGQHGNRFVKWLSNTLDTAQLFPSIARNAESVFGSVDFSIDELRFE